jgi:glutamate transport system substrate-binding protein
VEKVLDGTVSAMSTDGTILAGYAAQNEGELKVVGDQFSEERIGVGYSIDRPEMCQWIVDTIQETYDSGDYEEAFNATLGPSGVEVPELPEMDACES